MAFISAGEIEKYAYCPLSWWLSRNYDVTTPALKEGQKEHESLSKNLSEIVDHELKANIWERAITWFAITATVLAIIGVVLKPVENPEEWRKILSVLSIPWIIAGLIALYSSASAGEERNRAKYEQITILTAIIAMITVLNAVTILGIEPRTALIYEFLALLWLIAANIALYLSLRASHIAASKRKEQLIRGKIVYIGGKGSKLFKSEKYGIVGKPDYVIEVNGEAVPVEVKTGRKPRGPLFSHILRVGAYCLLLEEDGEKVSHGILKYDDVEYEIEYDEELKKIILAKTEEMRNLLKTGGVHRNHHRVGKCISCSRRAICPEKLA
ncbi:MAG: CRISPR-associated protein Cas4 [Methanomassiliicoccales archaeon]|jgi:CRISPR-associated exonuclease Cas4|nr:CRISPR-associated protein Cas4 [Methanomassiliicoccales archaeon]